MLALGTPAPDFSLPDVASGRTTSLADFSGKDALLVIFLCAHCPYVVHVAPELARIGRDYAGKSLGIVGITANDTAEYPQDAPEPTAAFARAQGCDFPIFFDESQSVAKAYTAACTPAIVMGGVTLQRTILLANDYFRATSDEMLAADWMSADLRAAIDAVLARQPVSAAQAPSIGCNIKWKPGNEPRYFLH